MALAMQRTQIAKLSRRGAILSMAGFVAACAGKAVLLDKTAAANIKQVGLPTVGAPTSPTVDVTNGAGKHFGLIGLVSSGVTFANRVGALTAIEQAQGFDPRASFTSQLTAELASHGYTVVPQPADANRDSFLANYDLTGSVEAVLDVYISSYGFVANDDSDDSPYRPAVQLRTRLVSAADRSVLMQDRMDLMQIDVPLAQPGGAPPAPYGFTSFSDVTKDPARAVLALRGGLGFAADAVCQRLA